MFAKDFFGCCVENRLQRGKNGSREIYQVDYVLFYIRNDGGFDQISVGCGYGDLQVDLKYIQEEELIGFKD